MMVYFAFDLLVCTWQRPTTVLNSNISSPSSPVPLKENHKLTTWRLSVYEMWSPSSSATARYIFYFIRSAIVSKYEPESENFHTRVYYYTRRDILTSQSKFSRLYASFASSVKCCILQTCVMILRRKDKIKFFTFIYFLNIKFKMKTKQNPWRPPKFGSGVTVWSLLVTSLYFIRADEYV